MTSLVTGRVQRSCCSDFAAGKLPSCNPQLPRLFERNRKHLQRLANADETPKMSIIFEEFGDFGGGKSAFGT